MSNKKIADVLKSILEKDRFAELKEQAKKGDALSQYVLGDIFFYGIDTNVEYWKNLERTIASAKYSAKKNVANFAFTCSCHQKPDYGEALKWYEKAASAGNARAKKQIEKILNGVQETHQDTIIQLFKKGL